MEGWLLPFIFLLFASATVFTLGMGLMTWRLLSASGQAVRRELNTAAAWQSTLERAIDAVPDWTVLVRDGVIIASNTPSGSAFRDTAARCVGQSIAEVYPEQDAAMLRAHIERARQSGRSLAFEYLFGQSRYGEARIFPIDQHVLIVTRDLTDKRSREEVLLESKERFALAVQGANDGLWDWNLETDEVYYSYSWRAIVGYAPSQEINTPAHWFDRIHPDDVEGVRSALNAHLDGDAARFESEHRIQTTSETWLWVLTRGMAVRDAEGIARRIAGSLTDLTNRRVVEVTQEKADLLEHATRSVGIGIAVLDGHGTIHQVDQQLHEMTEEWRSPQQWWQDVSLETRPPEAATCPRCNQPHRVGVVLAEVYRPKTDAFPVGDTDLLSRVFEIAWAGHAHEIGDDEAHVLLIKDVTQRLRAQRKLDRAHEALVLARDEALAASRAKSAFLANMSHELRTPLNHILGYAEMVAEELVDSGQAELATDLGKVQTSGHHLLELIGTLLDLSRVEAGMAGLELAWFDLGTLFTEVVARWEPEARARGNLIVLDPPERMGQMNANRDQVQRVLDALVSNAVKFTQEGRIVVEIEVLRRGSREWFATTVTDTGIGIDPDHLTTLFDRFATGDPSRTRTEGGTGVGLTLAQRFTEMMGGDLVASSALGQGSTFRLLLPRDVGQGIDEEVVDESTVEIRDALSLSDPPPGVS